jgi:hypothetical protein
MGAVVDWVLLGRAVEFYKGKGYQYIEADWSVPDEVVAITAPNEEWRAGSRISTGTLVGSAEQSFLALDLAGKLPKGKFVACTPCFRPAETPDELHQFAFMKVELYDNIGEITGLFQLLSDAGECFRLLGAPEGALYTSQEDGVIDINLNGIEIGSYGVRKHGDHLWQFGTGLALPRFSQALAA